ncbi:hypothetical protein QS257_08045 [Terrilactibacillus sp. S3-3]|nr:hypothetical protein QS257_08045 [Terrilactibacillus sp. S3-3]
MVKLSRFVSILVFGSILFTFSVPALASSRHTGQTVTAYTGSTKGAGTGAGYRNHAYTTVAVHTKKYGSTSAPPIFSYGTVIKTDKSLYIYLGMDQERPSPLRMLVT